MENEYINIGTFNIHKKLQDANQRQIPIADMVKRKMDICCFQETYYNENSHDISSGRLYCRRKEGINKHRQYGLAFYVANKWIDELREKALNRQIWEMEICNEILSKKFPNIKNVKNKSNSWKEQEKEKK